MNNVNVSVFSPIARQNLVEVNHINTFDKDITLTFTATESSTQFYITKGWSVASVTPLESITLDYLYIQEHESQQMEINCEVLNSTITYLLNTGVNMADSNIARNSLNNSFKRNLSYAAYQQAITSCANTPGVNTLAEGGVEFEEVKGGYRFGFNGQEKDNEVVGYGNVYDLGLRQYDARLGRMFSIDPRGGEYPWQSPYAYHRNNPMNWIDYLGGGDPPASDQITGLLGQAEQENAKGKQLKDMGDAKIIESIKLLDQASAMLNGQVSNADLTKALNLTEHRGS
ncbi:MAG: hypothetical protein MUC81_14330 [Bacteroidia bacterium]|nr:hypothetical protein [Bacteroidia bacterium]